MLAALMQRFDGGSVSADRADLPDAMALLATLAALVSCAFALSWGIAGVGAAAVLASLIWFAAERLTPETVMRLYRAEHIDPSRGGQILDTLGELSRRAEFAEPPDFYVVPSATLSAFSAGRGERRAVAVTEGMLRQLTMREITGILAHEIAHMRAGHLQVFALADGLTRVAQLLAYAALALAALNLISLVSGEAPVAWSTIVLLYLAPLLMNTLQSRLSHTREFEADRLAIYLSGDPMGMASAISRTEAGDGRVWEDLTLPVPGRRIAYPSLLRAHPATRVRIDRVLAEQQSALNAPLAMVEEPMVSLAGFGPIAMRPRLRFPGIWF